MPDLKPTEEERKAIASLKRLANKKWPESLWLFSASGTLFVMRKKPDGERAILYHGGMDPDYILDHIHGIDNDGGDW